MVQAALTTVSSLLGAQSRLPARPDRQNFQSALPSMVAAGDTKTRKAIRDEAFQERIYTILSQPEVMAMVMGLAGIVVANRIPYTPNAEANTLLASTATIMVVCMACGYAGVGDLTSLAIALMAGGGSFFGTLFGESNGNVSEWYRYVNPLGFLVSELF